MPRSQPLQAAYEFNQDITEPVAEAAIVNGVSSTGGNAKVLPGELNATSLVSNGRSKSPASTRETNGATTQQSDRAGASVKSRKRSRSGTRIARPLVEGNYGRRRGTQDADGRAVENVRLHNYVQAEHQHYAAMLRQDVKEQQAIEGQRRERHANLRRRGVHVDEDRERQQDDKFDDYPLKPLLDAAAVYGPGYGQYGTLPNRPPSKTPGIIYPARRPRIGGRKAREVRIPRRELRKQADQLEELVPIRIDLEWEKVRLRDTFTWNLHDRMIPIGVFAEHLVEDFGLSLENCRGLVRQVAAHMEEQVQEYMPHAFTDDGPDDPHLPYTAYKDDEMRIIIKLNITIGQHTLVDQFEWDMNNASDSPELFARQMASDLSLSGEFATAIAHDIREQCQLFTRSLYIIGHPFDGRPVRDQDLQAGMMPSPMPSAFRPYQATKEFVPYLYELNEADLERTELSLSREERRQKRSVNRRGGPALPDLKDRRRTIRTLIVSSIIPGAADTLEDSRIFKRVVTASGKTKRPGYRDRDSLDGSDQSESEESTPGSPVIPQHLLSGTARTRGMRGAATAAQGAIKGALARSATPETLSMHHHETRTGRRRDYREESVGDAPSSLVVKLKVPPPQLKKLLRDLRHRPRTNLQDSPHGRSRSETPGHGTPNLGTMGPPSQQPHGSPGQQRDMDTRHPHSVQIGRAEAKGPPTPQHPAPPAPDWLLNSLWKLRKSYPDDLFEGVMKYTAVSKETDMPVGKPDGHIPPDQLKYMYYPRIKCIDCPGKVYTPGPETGVTNFEVHLKNKEHRQKVDARLSGR